MKVVVALFSVLATCVSQDILYLNGSKTCESFEAGDDYRPTSPRVLCCLL